MSLHALAGHMAAKGRGPDSMLVHMTPDEVQSLQTMARAQGGEVTINPETGLPEAGFLSDTLKALAPMALGAVLGPAGFGLSATMAGVATGGITALATGSLSRGLMAGMGAYGGAGLAEGLMGAGTGAMAASDIAAQQAAGSFPTLAEGATQEQIAKYATDVGALRDSALSKAGEAGIGAKLSAGAGQMASNPSMYGKEMLTGLAAISPMMASEGVQTTTKRPDTGYIRNYTFDPYGQTYTSAGVYPASEYKGMADGGIVALAAGGVSDTDIQNWMAANQGADDKTIAAAMQQYGVTPGQLSSAMGYNPAEVQQRYEYAIAPQIVSQYSEGVAGPGGTTAQQGSGYLGIYDQLTKAGISPEELYNAPGYQGWSQPAISRAYDVAAGINAFDPRTDVGSPSDKEWAAFMDTNKFGVRDIAQATGLSEAEVQRRYDAAKFVKPVPVVQPSIATEANLPGGVSGGGNTVVNPNGTITTAPNIPGRPEGGFTGMGQVKDAYTQGGGSLGYAVSAPKTMDEFNQRFNKQTGDSLAAYEYLMGKGSYPTKSGVEQLMRPYSEVTMGIPPAEGRPTQKYIFDAAAKRYVENPNYKPMSYNSKGERIVGLSPAEVLKGVQPFKEAKDDTALFDWVTANNVSEAQLAAAMGISLAEARARLAAVKKVKDATAKSTTNMNDIYGGSASDGSTGGGGVSGPGGVGDGGASPGAGQGTAAGVGDTIATGGLVPRHMALGGLGALAAGGATSQYNLGGYSDGGRLLRGPGDGVSDSIPATIGDKQPARLADGEFVVPARIVSELGNGSTEAGARKLYAMMDRVQKARGKTTGKNRVAANTRSDKYLPA